MDDPVGGRTGQFSGRRPSLTNPLCVVVATVATITLSEAMTKGIATGLPIEIETTSDR